MAVVVVVWGGAGGGEEVCVCVCESVCRFCSCLWMIICILRFFDKQHQHTQVVVTEGARVVLVGLRLTFVVVGVHSGRFSPLCFAFAGRCEACCVCVCVCVCVCGKLGRSP